MVRACVADSSAVVDALPAYVCFVVDQSAAALDAFRCGFRASLALLRNGVDEFALFSANTGCAIVGPRLVSPENVAAALSVAASLERATPAPSPVHIPLCSTTTRAVFRNAIVWLADPLCALPTVASEFSRLTVIVVESPPTLKFLSSKCAELYGKSSRFMGARSPLEGAEELVYATAFSVNVAAENAELGVWVPCDGPSRSVRPLAWGARLPQDAAEWGLYSALEHEELSVLTKNQGFGGERVRALAHGGIARIASSATLTPRACFSGGAYLRLKHGCFVRVSEVNKGDFVNTGVGYAEVEAVVVYDHRRVRLAHLRESGRHAVAPGQEDCTRRAVGLPRGRARAPEAQRAHPLQSSPQENP